MAVGTENGKLMLAPYTAIPEKTSKMLQGHKKSVTFVGLLNVAEKEMLVSCGEDCMVTIWILPFNILKYEIDVGKSHGYVVE